MKNNNSGKINQTNDIKESKAIRRNPKLTRSEQIERTLITGYRKKIWNRFLEAINEYHMIADGDKIAVCISGGKDSMLLAKCFQELKAHGKFNFDVEYLVMNPGYAEENRQRIIENAKLLNIPITMFETHVFEHVEKIEKHPCFICAKMRRGHLYRKAKELGCNKIALGHHFDDVVETILIGLFYGAQYQTMMPKVKSTYHEGMELIRPLYLVREQDILSWVKKNELEFINCACKITKKEVDDANASKRAEVKQLVAELKKKYKNIDVNIFRSAQGVSLDTVLSYKLEGVEHNFLDDYYTRKRNIQNNENN